MKRSAIVVSVLLLGLVTAALLRAAPEAPARAAPELVQAKIDAARKTYDVVWQKNKEGLVPFVELPYRWSRRWLEAVVESSDKKIDQRNAYQAHLARMQTLERITRERYRNRVVTVEEVTAAEFYTLEARLWVDQATAAKK